MKECMYCILFWSVSQFRSSSRLRTAVFAVVNCRHCQSFPLMSRSRANRVAGHGALGGKRCHPRPSGGPRSDLREIVPPSAAEYALNHRETNTVDPPDGAAVVWGEPRMHQSNLIIGVQFANLSKICKRYKNYKVWNQP